MLDVQPATGRRPGGSHRRFGLALAGGGPLGAFYEIGCLHAIEESLDGFGLTELEMYVGVSSGAMVTGTNGGAGSDPPSRPSRACRRQVKRREGAMPCRRATVQTDTPGSNVCATRRALSSNRHRRRRSGPPRTSTRIALT